MLKKIMAENSFKKDNTNKDRNDWEQLLLSVVKL